MGGYMNWADGDPLTPTTIVNQNSITSSGAPTAGTSSGTTGSLKWGVISATTYLFVCTSTDSWSRVALVPF